MPTVLRLQRDEERKERMREQLLTAATRVFVKNGYHKTLISDIVAEAGVGQGSFYRNFPDKRSIFETLLEDFVEDLLNEFSDMQAHPPQNIEEYRQASIDAIKHVAALIEEKLKLCLLVLREGPSIDKEFAQKLENILNQFAQLAQFYLDNAIEQGFARKCRSDIVSQSLIGIVLRLLDQWGNENFKKTPLENLIIEAIDFAFLGFGKE